jgi:hypothetical protein
MKIKIRIGDVHLLLTAEQVDQITHIVEGSTIFEEKYVGDNKGYTGHNNCYEKSFTPFVASMHMSVGIMSDEEIDKFTTLNAMRRSQLEGE